MAQAFRLETERGVRMVEFDPDVIRWRDVLMLVDGKRVAGMPYPKPSAPYGEAAFEVEGYRVVAAAFLSAEPTAAFGLVCDLFVDGRSLTDGSSLVDFRKRVPAPGESYPNRFRVIDMTLQIAPAASAPGLGMAIVRRAGELGWPLTLGMVALMVGGVGFSTVVATRAWERIRLDKSRSVSSRTLRGGAAVFGSYLVAGIAVLALALVIGRNR
jgi:hypothetical protein